MPIAEIDPWRMQYFEGVRCPDDVRIPTEDSDAWMWNPDHRWVYDKLAVARSQELDAAPHGVEPPSFPVFSKPVYNLKGMGVGSRVIASAEDYREAQTAGHFWSTLLTGAHVSSDVAVLDGEPMWWRHATGETTGDGTFDHWAVHAEPDAAVEDWCGTWCRTHLKGYSGMVNFETIGARIIEMHLRFADQWPDLYGKGWVEALVRLYEKRQWRFDDHDRRTGYSVVLFLPHGRRYRHPSAALIDELKRRSAISSVQITFHEERPAHLHAMPPGGFRVAIVNCWDRAAGEAAREILRRHFEATAAAM